MSIRWSWWSADALRAARNRSRRAGERAVQQASERQAAAQLDMFPTDQVRAARVAASTFSVRPLKPPP
jgi:hypothetical protein